MGFVNNTYAHHDIPLIMGRCCVLLGKTRQGTFAYCLCNYFAGYEIGGACSMYDIRQQYGNRPLREKNMFVHHGLIDMKLSSKLWVTNHWAKSETHFNVIDTASHVWANSHVYLQSICCHWGPLKYVSWHQWYYIVAYICLPFKLLIARVVQLCKTREVIG